MKFQLGRLVATAGVNNWMQQNPVRTGFISNSVGRHLAGDWGDVCEEDKELNNQALNAGDRILSSYSHNGDKIWIITEHDRSVTTVLFPDEY